MSVFLKKYSIYIPLIFFVLSAIIIRCFMGVEVAAYLKGVGVGIPCLIGVVLLINFASKYLVKYSHLFVIAILLGIVGCCYFDIDTRVCFVPLILAEYYTLEGNMKTHECGLINCLGISIIISCFMGLLSPTYMQMVLPIICCFMLSSFAKGKNIYLSAKQRDYLTFIFYIFWAAVLGVNIAAYLGFADNMLFDLNEILRPVDEFVNYIGHAKLIGIYEPPTHINNGVLITSVDILYKFGVLPTIAIILAYSGAFVSLIKKCCKKNDLLAKVGAVLLSLRFVMNVFIHFGIFCPHAEFSLPFYANTTSLVVDFMLYGLCLAKYGYIDKCEDDEI